MTDCRYYIAAVTKDGSQVLESSQIDEEEVKSYVSPIGLDVLRNYWNFTISADVDCFTQTTSLPYDLREKLGVRVGKKLEGFAKRILSIQHNDGFVILTTYGVRPSELVQNIRLKRFIEKTLELYEVPSKLRS